MPVKRRKGGAPLPSPLCCTRGLFSAGETEPPRPPSAPRTWTQINIFQALYFDQMSLPPFLPGWGSISALAATEARSGCLWARTAGGGAGEEAAGPL